MNMLHDHAGASAVRGSESETARAHPTGAGRLWLLVSSAAGVRTHELPDHGDVTIGRGSDSDVRLDAQDASRRHALLRIGRTLTIEDLDSRNGTRVGGVALSAGQRATLGLGAIVEIGETTLIVARMPGERGDSRHQPAPTPSPDKAPRGGALADAVMLGLYTTLDVVGPSALPVIVLGETGTGKEVFARAVHEASSRTGAFVAVNCAEIPEPLLESELFGHEKGSFTGAASTKAGLVETAEGGTLFLDEVGELPLRMQAKLLRVLEAREVRRVGAVRPRPVDVRYVAATNRDLQAAVMANEFRADLFFRLNGFAFELPPLRQRPHDVVSLARHFAVTAGAIAPLGEQVVRALLAHDWPGNVRELRTVVERAVALARGRALQVEDLLLASPARTTSAPAPPASDERTRIVQALLLTSGNQKEAARQLGVSRRTLIKKIERYGIGRPRKSIAPT